MYTHLDTMSMDLWTHHIKPLVGPGSSIENNKYPHMTPKRRERYSTIKQTPHAIIQHDRRWQSVVSVDVVEDGQIIGGAKKGLPEQVNFAQ